MMTDNVKQCHDGNQLFGNSGNALNTAQEDESCQNGDHNANHHAVNAERIVERITNGVGLHHVAHKAEGKDQSNGEENGQELAKLALECRADVIRRAAGHLAVHRGAVGLGQNGFGVNGSHAEKGRNPGPEQCAGAAADQGGGAAGNVAGANLCGNGSGQCLKRAHAVFISCLAVQAETFEQVTHTICKTAQLNKVQLDSKEDAGAHQQEQQQIIPQNVAGLLYDLRKCCHD